MAKNNSTFSDKFVTKNGAKAITPAASPKKTSSQNAVTKALGTIGRATGNGLTRKLVADAQRKATAKKYAEAHRAASAPKQTKEISTSGFKKKTTTKPTTKASGNRSKAGRKLTY